MSEYSELRIGYSLDRPVDVLRTVFGDITSQIAEGTGHTILSGTPA